MNAVFPNAAAPQTPDRSIPIPAATRSQRILSLVLPRLPTDRIARNRWGASWRSTVNRTGNGAGSRDAGSTAGPVPGPIACAETERSALRLSAVNDAAAARGLRLGQGVAEARAMCPALDVMPADPAADRALIEAIADWCDRYTPLVALDPPDGLFLDITGCAHLFGGEAALMDDLLLRLFHLGFEARAAIAATPGLAWAMARFGSGGIAEAAPVAAAATDGQVLPAAVHAFPVAALRLDAETAASLERVGLKRIGDLISAPRAPLARRFGPQPLRRLDQMAGREEEPIAPRRPVAMLSAERRLAEPVADPEALDGLVRQLAASLKPGLEQRGEGARLIECKIFRVDGKVLALRAGSARPIIEPERIRILFRTRLEALHDDLDVGYGFETVRLSVLRSEPLDPVQGDFGGAAGADDDGLSALADRLAARLGSERVVTPVLHESHVPERAARFVPAAGLGDRLAPDAPSDRLALEAERGEGASCPAASPHARRPRPVRVFAHPEPVETVAVIPDGPPVSFRWRRARHRVARAEGPERIAAEWWVDGEAAPSRDYYRIEDEGGRRFWIYREGLYGREVAEARWFMHGIFA